MLIPVFLVTDFLDFVNFQQRGTAISVNFLNGCELLTRAIFFRATVKVLAPPLHIFFTPF